MKKQNQQADIPRETKFNDLLQDIPRNVDKANTQFWKAIIHDTMDIYSLATAAYVFAVILPIVFYEIVSKIATLL